MTAAVADDSPATDLRRYALLVLALLLVGGAAQLAAAGLVPLGGLAVGSLALLAWLALATGAVSAALRRRGEPAVMFALMALPAVALLAGWLAQGPIHYFGQVLPSARLLAQHRALFDQAVAARDPGFVELPGVYAVERSGRRIAFVTRNGLLGNWTAIVHDPSDALAAAKGWGGGARAPEVRRIFAGSETRWCHPLGDHYFHCQFD